jgi:ABC-type taurine transport system ATPase subunit
MSGNNEALYIRKLKKALATHEDVINKQGQQIIDVSHVLNEASLIINELVVLLPMNKQTALLAKIAAAREATKSEGESNED